MPQEKREGVKWGHNRWCVACGDHVRTYFNDEGVLLMSFHHDLGALAGKNYGPWPELQICPRSDTLAPYSSEEERNLHMLYIDRRIREGTSAWPPIEDETFRQSQREK